MRLRSTAYRVTADEVSHTEPGRTQSLGGMLLESGQLSADQLARVVARQEETGKLFGETAIELGFLTHDDIERAIAQQQSFYLLQWGDTRLDPAVIAAFDPHDAIARCARSIRGRIASTKLEDGRPAKMIALLSVDVPIEASLIAANLGVSCAQAGYRTLLVDANIDAPMQHGLFKLGNRVGLSNLLSRSADFQEALQPSAIPQLSIVTAGPSVPNCNELLERERLFMRLSGIAHMFDVMLVDAGFLGPEDISFLGGAEGAVITVRRDSSGMRSFQTMVSRLKALEVVTIGSAIVD